MSSSQNSFVFAGIICVVCSILLTGAATGLKSLQEENVKIDRQKNVLKALGLVDFDAKLAKSDVIQTFDESVLTRWVDSEGRILSESQEGALPIFLVMDGDRVDLYAVPISGKGLWSTIKGYFAIQGDGKTVAGLAIYEHGETPGLGGEAEKKWFRDNFIGKQIVNEVGDFVSVGVIKGKVADRIKADQQDYFVDGISGATVTSRGIDWFLKSDLMKYEAFSKRLR